MAALGAVITVIPVWMVQGSAEEIVTRGYLLQNNATQLPGSVAVTLVSVGFAVAHLNFTPLVLLNTILVALGFAFVSLGQGSLWLAMGLHVGWNFAQGNIFGVPVSGDAYDVAIWAFGPAAGKSDFVTGGEYGVEASPYATVVLEAFAFVSYRYYRRTEAARAGTVVPAPEYERRDDSAVAVPAA